jgi:hypothetical protein
VASAPTVPSSSPNPLGPATQAAFGQNDEQGAGWPRRTGRQKLDGGEQPQQHVAEIHRVLRPGGALQFADVANGRPVPPGALRDIDLWAA